jgi:NitT/TauT family transport system substrate-binding protein
MPDQRRRRTFAILTVALAVLAATAYSDLCRAESTVHIGITNSTTDAPFFIAEDKGYFAAIGLHAEFVPFDSAAKMVPSLGIGELDAAGGAASSALYNAVERGIDIKVIADKAHHQQDFDHAGLVVRKDLIDSGKFKSYSDLRGLRVAVSGAGSSDESVLNEALKAGGLKWSDVNVEYMGFQEQPAAYANGAIDAGITAEPALTNVVKAGTGVLFARVGAFYPMQQGGVLIYGVNFLDHDRAVGEKFVEAYIRAVRFYNNAILDGTLTGPTAPEVIAALTKYTPIKDPAFFRATTPPAINPDGVLNLESMQKDWQFFKDMKEIDGTVPVDRVVDLSFVKDALKVLGPYHPMKSSQMTR